MTSKYIKETLKYILRCKLFLLPYLKEIESLYKLPPKELKKRNEKVFLELFRYAYTKSPFYNQLYKKAGIQLDDIQKIDDIKKLPIITKDMIREHPEELLTDAKWKMIKSHTSGTTGTPLNVFLSWSTIWKWQAYLYYYREKCGFKYGEPLVSLRGNLNRKNKHMLIHISNTLYLSSYYVNENTVEDYWQRIQRHRPKAIEGFPSTLYDLSLQLKEKRLKCNIPLCFTSSETLYDYQRDLIEDVLGTQIYDHYGMTERTISLSENFDHKGYFEQPGFSINEYFEEGAITTSLINSSFPLIRYKTNDIFEYSKNDKTENIVIKRIKGRDNQYIIGKDGTKYSGGLTYIVRALKNIKNAQLIQYEKGKLTFNIVTDDEIGPQQLKEINRYVDERIGIKNMDITINKIDESQLIYTNGHKFNFIVSYINS